MYTINVVLCSMILFHFRHEALKCFPIQTINPDPSHLFKKQAEWGVIFMEGETALMFSLLQTPYCKSLRLLENLEFCCEYERLLQWLVIVVIQTGPLADPPLLSSLFPFHLPPHHASSQPTATIMDVFLEAKALHNRCMCGFHLCYRIPAKKNAAAP